MNASGVATLIVFTAVAGIVALAAWHRARATTLDFYLAGRRIGTITNACAICGDYFSAASFLGVAAAVYAAGLDGVWYATGFAAGFVPVLLFVAAPLRRFGHVSIPDFLATRFDSDRIRRVAVIAVELVILAYLVPQAVGSGVTWELLVGVGVLGLSPYASGVVVSGVVVAAMVMVGGMRGTTWNQALQFVFLLAVLIWLAVIVLGAGFSYSDAVTDASAAPLANPDADAGQLVPVTNQLRPDQPARFGLPGGLYGGLGKFALLTTLVLGTTGLPHVMNRYFTSPSGRVARVTTVWVLGFAGLFYAIAVLLGTAARVLVADNADLPWLAPLTVDGVLIVPEHALLALGRLFAGFSGLGLVATAAFAAMVSTIGGLLLAAAASWGHDIYQRYVRPDASQRAAVTAGRVAVVVASFVAAVAALAAEPMRLASSFPSIVAAMVTWAFALAASALTPALLLSIWWPRVTERGIHAGIWTGMLTAIALLGTGLVTGADPAGGLGAVLLAPAVVAAPVAAAVVVGRSLLDAPPERVARVWTRLHGTAVDRQVERLARLTLRDADRRPPTTRRRPLLGGGPGGMRR